MTGNDGMRVLDLDMELGEHAAGIMQEHGKAWLKGRLMYYGEKSDALFKAAGEVLAEAPDRASRAMSKSRQRAGWQGGVPHQAQEPGAGSGGGRKWGSTAVAMRSL